MEKLLESIEKYLVYAVIFLVPVTVLPISPNPYDVPKLAILSFGVALILLVKAIRVITSKKLDFSIGTFDLPVLIIALSFLVSTVLRTPNKMDALLLPGSATAVLAGALLYFLINQLSSQEKSFAGKLLLVSGLGFSLIMLAAKVGLLDKIPQLPPYIRISSFNPAGGSLPATLFLLTLIPLGIGMVLTDKDVLKKALLGASLALVVIGFVIGAFSLLPGKPTSPRLPDIRTSWFIAIDSLKESPIIGIGAGNYLTAFARYRPLDYNASDLWAIRFSTANNYYLTVFTEVGLLGAAGLIFMFMSVYRFAKKRIDLKRLSLNDLLNNSSLLSLILLIVLLAFFPSTTLLTALIFILLALVSESKKTSLNLSTQAPSPMEIPTQTSQKLASSLPALLVTLPLIIVVVVFGFNAVRILSAERNYKESIDALIENRATDTYDLMQTAINQNPLVDRYHVSYAQVNLALANAIAQNEEITDQDRTNIAQLIQQAIREGKAAVALNPLRSGNWEVLGRIYQAITTFAQGADAFAAQSFSQAVALDPINPNLRISLGGIYYTQGNFDSAIRVFELATVAKPDLANAHYNLAFALRENGEIDRAISEITITLSLVDRNSNDFEVAKTALEDLESRREASTEAATGEELTPPQPAEEPVIVPPIELPEDSEPPEAEVTPTPSPEVSPTESPIPTP